MADEATERITILLQARDADMKRALDRNTQAIRRYEREATKATTAAARNIEQNMAKSNAAFAGMAKAGVAAVGVLVASLASGAVKNAIDQLGNLSDAANRIGIDVEAFQGLQRGFQLAGVQADAFGNSLEMFTQKIGEAADGAGPLAQVLRDNGVAIRNQNGEIRPTLDLLNDFADIIDGTSSQAEKMALLNDAFGRSGREMALAFEGGSAAFLKMQEDAVEGGYVIDKEIIQRGEELGDKFDDLTLKASNFFKAFAVGVGESALGLKMMAEDLAALAVDSVTPEPLTVDEQAITALRQIGADAEALAGYLDRTANDLRRIGVEGYENLNKAASEMRRLNEGLIDGTISGVEFDSQMRTASETALGLMLSLEDVDQQQFGNVITSLGGLINGLVAAANAAAATRAEIARIAAAGSASLPALSGPAGMGAPPAGPSIPAGPPGRPEARPVDIDFGYNPAPSSGGGSPSGGGGGGTPSPAEPAYWDDLVQSVQDAQDALEAYNDTAEIGADAMANLFTSIIAGSSSAEDALAALLAQIGQVAMQSAFLSLAGMGGTTGQIFGALGSALSTPSYAGGGYTGSGPRSGGLDGMGGFPAILHPHETVIDHAIQPSAASGGGGNPAQINVNISLAGANGDAAVAAIAEAAARRGVAQGIEAYDRQKFANSRLVTGDRRRIS